jgi:hypothetical protein
MNLQTTYMGLKLEHPLVPSASPLGEKLDTIRQMEDAGSAPLLRPTKGIHVVVERRRIDHRHGIIFTSPIDGRVMFILPWGELSYIGTTDTDTDVSPDRLDILPDEVVYLLRSANARFPNARLPHALTRRLHQRTDGHPLFLVHVIEDLVEQGVIVEQDGGWCLAGSLDESASQAEAPGATVAGATGGDPAGWLAVLDTQVPKTVRAMIELHLERLDRPTRQALEAAAVAGMEFSAAEVAGALGMDVVQAEQACDDLARRHRFLTPEGPAFPRGMRFRSTGWKSPTSTRGCASSSTFPRSYPERW